MFVLPLFLLCCCDVDLSYVATSWPGAIVERRTESEIDWKIQITGWIVKPALDPLVQKDHMCIRVTFYWSLQ